MAMGPMIENRTSRAADAGRGGVAARLLCSVAVFLIALSGCGKDSYLTEPEGPVVSVEFGEGIEVITPSDTLVRFFEDFTPVTFQDRPAILLRNLVGEDVVEFPDLYGYRFVGVDGFYANMPGKGYGDNTWDQLTIGYLDLTDVRIVFETERDPNLRNGHNVKWLVRAEVLRSVDVVWPGGRNLVAVTEVETATVPEGVPGAGADGVVLTTFVEEGGPSDLVPDQYVYRVSARDGQGLPRLLTWAEMGAAYYLPGDDRVVMSEALGSAYQVDRPKTIRMEAKVR